MADSSTRSEAISRLFVDSALRCESQRGRRCLPKPRWRFAQGSSRNPGLEDTIPLGLPEIRRSQLSRLKGVNDPRAVSQDEVRTKGHDVAVAQAQLEAHAPT